MSQIQLETLRAVKAPVQAAVLSKLVVKEGRRGSLQWDRPEQFKSFYLYRGAFKEIVKADCSVTSRSHLVRDEYEYIGFALLASGQQVIHPTEGKYKGYFLDYWLKEGQSLAAHLGTVDALLHRAVDLHLRAPLMQAAGYTVGASYVSNPKLDVFSAIATMPIGQEEPPVGFAYHGQMQQIDGPAELSTDQYGDRYNIARAGKATQLYATCQAHVDQNN